jgi:hypothetical protein
MNCSILNGSDDGVLQSGLLIFWTLFIVLYSKNHNVSKAGSAFVPQVLSWVHFKELTSITGPE